MPRSQNAGEYRVRGAFPDDPQQRLKVYIVFGVIICCAVWLSYFVVTNFTFRKSVTYVETPGWKIAREVNDKLNAEQAFSDVGLVVTTERPLKFAVTGAVFRKEDLDRLPEVLHGIKPDLDFDLQVQVLPH